MAVLVYACRAQENASYTDFSDDERLKRKFFEWRFGEYERIDKNEVLQELVYHPHRRTPKEVWVMSEKFKDLCKTQDARVFFDGIINKAKNKVIFG